MHLWLLLRVGEVGACLYGRLRRWGLGLAWSGDGSAKIGEERPPTATWPSGPDGGDGSAWIGEEWRLRLSLDWRGVVAAALPGGPSSGGDKGVEALDKCEGRKFFGLPRRTTPVVLDVGCGTGVLSIFCAFAGATQVYAVDASDIALQAMEIVRENELSDKVIVLHGRIEDVKIEEKVDVIISEWMGYMLLYESMLGSVIFARDKWLKPGGLILPSHASLYLAPITNSQRYQDSVYFWRDVYGIKMSSMMPLAKQCAFMEPSVETISGENVLTWPTVVAQVDCYTIQALELETITATFKYTSMLQAPLHGFAFWFDVEFNGPMRLKSKKQTSQLLDGNSKNVNPSNKKKKADVSIVLSTAPEDAPTHWQQRLWNQMISSPVEPAGGQRHHELAVVVELPLQEDAPPPSPPSAKLLSVRRPAVPPAVTGGEQA
ncbi:hypothetical protein ABZP36_029984 [Zizania latifolia]